VSLVCEPHVGALRFVREWLETGIVFYTMTIITQEDFELSLGSLGMLTRTHLSGCS
jgi:hypothetical protein